MFEKVNPSHPDKVADRIAGAIVDLAYKIEKDPRIAVEVLIGHGYCHIIAEASIEMPKQEIYDIVTRIAGEKRTEILWAKQDSHLAQNQSDGFRCGDNGIFKGIPEDIEEHRLSDIAREIYAKHPYDGKYVLDRRNLIVCQSNVESRALRDEIAANHRDLWAKVNPLGDWTGGTDVDTGATNRKLGSDMGDAVTGGGLHGKDLSKADVSVNIWCHLEAERTGKPVTACCAIGDSEVNGVPYSEIVETARQYIKAMGGFEKFAEWGLI